MMSRLAVLILKTDFSEIPRLERFVELHVRDERQHKTKIVLTELFDNIVCHAKKVNPPRVCVIISTTYPLRVHILYRTANFNTFLERLARRTNLKINGESPLRPRFDGAQHRYRGLGLTMCVANAADIRTYSGLLWSRVSVVL